jgi:hypothetical protein
MLQHLLKLNGDLGNKDDQGSIDPKVLKSGVITETSTIAVQSAKPEYWSQKCSVCSSKHGHKQECSALNEVRKPAFFGRFELVDPVDRL